MTKTHRKVAKWLAIIMVTMTIFSAMSITAFANDHADRQFSFVFAQQNDKTNFFAKQDNSPVYMKCHSASHPYNAVVLGAYGLNQGAYDASGSYSFTTGTTRFMPASPTYSVYGIIGRPTYWDSSAWGYWSPDSV